MNFAAYMAVSFITFFWFQFCVTLYMVVRFVWLCLIL